MFKGMKVDRKFAAAVLAALLAGCTTPDSARRVCQPMDGLFPPDVKTVGIVSLSSILERDVFDRGVRLLEEAGYRVKVMPNAYGPEVAPPETRARLFEQAWLDPEIDLLFFSRGGEGAIDTIGLIDWERLRARDMRVIGFSDVTIVLQTMLAKKAGHPYSGPMLTNIAEPRMTTRSLDWFRRVTAGENLPPALTSPTCKPSSLEERPSLSKRPPGDSTLKTPTLTPKLRSVRFKSPTSNA